MNWFRQDENGRFLWPGFSENLRVLKWIIDRTEDRVGAKETAIGFLPEAKDIDRNGLSVSDGDLDELTRIDPAQWIAELEAIDEYLLTYGDRLPEALAQEVERVLGDLRVSAGKTAA